MADIRRHATANWKGTPKDGGGGLSAESGEFSGVNYSFPSRFQHESGSNPEELIGAAHAACFNMVVAEDLSAQGNPPDELQTRATVTLQEDGGNYQITEIHLETTATVDGVDREKFQKIAEGARDSCPVSQLLKPGLEKVTMEANLS